MTSSFESIALWNRDRRVIAVLGVFCLAHWAILWRGMFIVDAQYSDEAQSCVVVSLNHVFLNAGFFTSKSCRAYMRGLCTDQIALHSDGFRSHYPVFHNRCTVQTAGTLRLVEAPLP